MVLRGVDKRTVNSVDASTKKEINNLGDSISHILEKINENELSSTSNHDDVINKLDILTSYVQRLLPQEETTYIEDDEFKAHIVNDVASSDNSNNIMILIEHNEAEISSSYLKRLVDDKILKNTVYLQDVFNKDLLVNKEYISGELDDSEIYKIHNEYVLDRLYERGFRLFITTFGSSTTENLFDWVNNHEDVIFFGVTSTSSSDDFMENKPDRLIRTSISDNYLIQRLFNDILPNIKTLLMQGGHDSAELFNDDEIGVNPFKKVVYIYEPSDYTSNYGNELRIMTEKKGIEYESYELDPVYVPMENIEEYARNNDISLKNEDIIQALTNSNIDNAEFKDSDDKSLIIFNSSRGSDMFLPFDKEEYYKNFTMFGDTFTGMKTRFPFIEGLMPVGNFSQISYRISNKINDGSYLNPQLLSIYSLALEVTPVYMSLLNNGKFDAYKFLEKMVYYEWIKNESWAEKYLTVFKPVFKETGEYIPEKPNDISDEQWNLYFGINKYEIDKSDLIIMKHEVNPVQLVTVVDPSTVIPKETNENQVTYDENISRILELEGEIDTILDDDIHYYNDEADRESFIEFLDENHKDPMLPEEFTLYSIDHKLNNISSVEKDLTLDAVELDLSISREDYEEAQESGEFIVTAKVPSIKYDVNELFYDVGTETLINRLTRNYKEEEYNEREINITSLSEEQIIILYKGNVLRLGSYVDDVDEFDIQETIRTFVKVPLKINWLVIYHEFKVGDRVLVIPNSKPGEVIEVASNLWELKVKYDEDDNIEVNNDAEGEIFDGPEEQEESTGEDDMYNIVNSVEHDENGYALVNQSQVQKNEEVGDLYNPDEDTIGVSRKNLKFDL